MLQAFVSLKQQQPPRTESGLKTFFQGLVKVSFSSPTYFCTSAAPEPSAFSVAAAAKACAVEEVKWAQFRGEDPYWQATMLMPDKRGYAAMFYHFESEDGDKPVVETDRLIEFAREFYDTLEPRLIRLGDSEAREKLKSRHGLVLMPGLGRVEWLQLVHPDIYGELYNSSELAAAPAYAVEIMRSGGLFLRVYGDPKEWESEDNVSLANFIPGFLAGTANVTDGEKAKMAVRQIEKLWTRASKTAGKVAEIFHPPAEAPTAAAADDSSDATVKMSSPSAEMLADLGGSKPAEKEPTVEEAPILAAEPVATHEAPSTSEVQAQISSLAPDVQLQGNVATVNAPDLEQKLYRGRDGRLPASDFFIAFDTEEGKLLNLDKFEDFAAFLQKEDLGVNSGDRNEIISLVKKYHRTYLTHLSSVDGIPGESGKDKRLETFRSRVKAPYQDTDGETQKLHLWAFNPRANALEEMIIHQFKTWPLSMENRSQLTDLKASAATEPPPPVTGNTFGDSTGDDAGGEKKSNTTLILLVVLFILVAAAAGLYFSGMLG